MMVSINRVIISGSLRTIPQLVFESGRKRATFIICSKDYYRNKSGEMAHNDTFLTVIAYGNLAENCAKYLTKGKCVMCEGKLVDNGAVQASSVVFLENEKPEKEVKVEGSND